MVRSPKAFRTRTERVTEDVVVCLGDILEIIDRAIGSYGNLYVGQESHRVRGESAISDLKC